MLMNRRLYRCRHDRRLAGVAGGVAEFFDLDPTLVRLLFFLSIFVGGLGLLLYIGMAIIVPLEPVSADDAAREAAVEPEGHRHATRGGGRGTIVVGLALILFGGLALVDSILPAWADAERYLVPAFVVGVGALLVASAIRREPTEPTKPRESMET
jgi:phage shock protein C